MKKKTYKEKYERLVSEINDEVKLARKLLKIKEEIKVNEKETQGYITHLMSLLHLTEFIETIDTRM